MKLLMDYRSRTLLKTVNCITCSIGKCSLTCMKPLYFIIICIISSLQAFALDDTTVVVPIQRRLWHDKINNEIKFLDKADGKADNQLKVGKNETINLQINDALFRRVKSVQDWIELNQDIKTNNDKIRFLIYVESLLKNFRSGWKKHEFNPVVFPDLMNCFEECIKAQAEKRSIVPFIEPAVYEIAKINTEIFVDNPAQSEARDIVYQKFCARNPDKILQTIKPFADKPFADSLIVVAAKKNPAQLYSYAQSSTSTEGKLIHRNNNNLVKAVAELSQTPNALFYFPFLDEILNGRLTIDSIRKFVGKSDSDYDSVGYYKLLVRTEISYFRRMAPPLRDTPVAVFGPNGLRETLRNKAIQHFITPINNLHEENNLAIRMRAIQPLNAQDLYYMIVMGENDIYTSSYKHSFSRLLDQMGAKPSGDSLLLSVHFDYFRKFLKMAANYNKLDTFLKTMPSDKSELVMKAFVARLDESGNLEDAVDVADSYSSISNKNLLNTIMEYVKQNEKQAIEEGNSRGQIIYGLLKSIFLSADSSNKVDLTSQLGIPSIYEIKNEELRNENGKVIQQVYWYGDDDGKAFFPRFIASFPAKDWKITPKKEWYEISSVRGNVIIYANRPLDNDANLDDSAQIHLNKYLDENGLLPSIVVHRGHSYWLPRTIRRMAGDAKIVVLGSCGGYKNLSDIVDNNPDAHIISTKEIGTGDINRTILNYLNQNIQAGQSIVWKSMWSSLGKTFASDPSRAVRDSWDDYIPPYKNLGAIFIKAYNKKTEGE